MCIYTLYVPCTSIPTCIHTYIHTYVQMCVYTEGKREREKRRLLDFVASFIAHWFYGGKATRVSSSVPSAMVHGSTTGIIWNMHDARASCIMHSA